MSGFARNEDVCDGECRIERELGRVAAVADLLGQIARGMSISTPQPSPSPSTLPARCSIFCSASKACRYVVVALAVLAHAA